MRFLAFLLCILHCVSGCAQDALRTETVRTFTLGDSTVSLIVHQSSLPGPLYYNMHDDESTSVDAAKETVRLYGGVLYELVHTGHRYIGFNYDSTYYAIDPNRIYTDAGIWRELRRIALLDSLMSIRELRAQDSLRLEQMRDSLFNAGDSLLYYTLQELSSEIPVIIEGSRLTMRVPAPPLQFVMRDTLVFGMVKAFADTLLALMRIDSQQLIIALHNNTNNGYSLNAYALGSIYQDEAHAIYRGLHPDPDDFYFVTERSLFEVLQPNHYHIVMQDNHKMTDDGSLSVYCGSHGIQYVNVEAQHKHVKEQREMLEILIERWGGN